MAADRRPCLALVLSAAVLVAACSRTTDVAPLAVEAVGAPDYFGRGIVRLGDIGDRLLVHVSKPSFWAIIRFDAAGDVMAAAVADARRDPGMAWLAVPAGRLARQGAATTASNPACSDQSARGRRECAIQPRVTTVGPMPLRAGESLILFVSVEPIRAATVEDRLNLVPPGAGIARVPAFIMAGREDIWAAYLVRR